MGYTSNTHKHTDNYPDTGIHRDICKHSQRHKYRHQYTHSLNASTAFRESLRKNAFHNMVPIVEVMTE